MEYLETMVQLAQAASEAIRLGRTLMPKLGRFSQEEKTLLQAAQDGKFTVCDFSDLAIVWAGGRQWGSPDDPEEVSRYLDAFERLCRRGLVRHIGKNHFLLTEAGFQIAKQLQSSQTSFWRRLFTWLGRFCF